MSENAGGAPGGQATLPKVLVVDDDKDARVALAETLGAEGFEVVAVPDGESLRRLRAIAPPLGEEGPLRWLMGPSGRIQDITEQIREVADSNLIILIQGETGTGKELVARAIHQMSYRRDQPFVALDCGAAQETLIEAELFGYEKGAFTGALRRKNGYFHFAQGGTLFFDEIANLHLTTQAKLLRVLQERRVQRLGGQRATDLDVRILAAYSAPLVDEVLAGRFRQDLYHRLREFVIVLPPLRERPEDIPYLAQRFLIETSIELRRPLRSISDEALELLRRYSWPGNVRELRNVIRRAVVLSSDLIQPTALAGLFSDSAQTPETPPDPAAPAGLSLKQIAETATAEAEARAIRRALQTARGKKSEAARLLKVDYKTLHLKMKRYRIYTKDFPI